MINVKTKVFLKTGYWSSQKAEKHTKNRTEVWNLTKACKS